MDPFRFEQVAPRGPEVGRDRGWEENQRVGAVLQNLELMTQNPLAAAAYGTARVAGASEKTSESAAQLAGAAGDVLLAVGAGKMAVRAARAPAIEKPVTGPLTPAETAAARTFLVDAKTPAKYIDETVRGFGTGTRVEALESDIHGFRYHGSMETARGRWVTEEPVNAPIRELALNRKDNPATHMTEWVVPAGTKVIRGPVGPLFGQPGGGSQIFVPDPSVFLREP